MGWPGAGQDDGGLSLPALRQFKILNFDAQAAPLLALMPAKNGAGRKRSANLAPKEVRFSRLMV